MGELHQQFSLEENIQMSLFAAEFFRKSRELLGEHVNLNYVPSGYLSLATGEQADILHKNAILQNRLGAKNVTMTPRRLKERFPWLNVNGIELGRFLFKQLAQTNAEWKLIYFSPYLCTNQVAMAWKMRDGLIHGHF